MDEQPAKQKLKMDSGFRRNYRFWRIATTLRWLALVFGPVAIFIDDFLYPWIEQSGLPQVITMEDLTRWFVLDLLPLDLWIDLELFEYLYHLLNKVSCVALLLFIPLAHYLKRKTEGAAREVAVHEARMTMEVEDDA